MEPEVIERLLPTVYQLATRPGSPLDAAIRAMSDLHAPDEALLAAIETVFDPYRAPEPFVFWLTKWLGIEWLVADAPDEVDGLDPQGLVPTFSPGVGRLREVVAAGHALAQWRGTEIGLRLFLTAATGELGFTVTQPDNRPFHLVVHVPARAVEHIAVVRRIVDHWKPAATTAEVVTPIPAPQPDEPAVPADTGPEPDGDPP
jgi:phage tail-like protein